jgi:hypothetical protein
MKEPGFISIRLQPTELVLLIPEEIQIPKPELDCNVS